jgi:hypothetical protein
MMNCGKLFVVGMMLTALVTTVGAGGAGPGADCCGV